jgi:hypothetical protein
MNHYVWEFDLIWIAVIALPIFLFIPVGLSFVVYDTDSYTGYIESVSYSQSGSGSSDITVIYFTGRTLIINQNVEINAHCNATIIWREGVFVNGKRFDSISYT